MRLGFIQALGGLVLGLIALFASYDHLNLACRTLQLQQQWGIPLIAASVATVFIGASEPLQAGAREAAMSHHELDAQDQTWVETPSPLPQPLDQPLHPRPLAAAGVAAP